MNRSFLMVAGDKKKHLDKLPNLKCDVAMINLEDGVFDKAFALNLLKQKFPNGLKQKEKKIVIRVNSLKECGKDDIKVINTLKPDAIRVPKIKDQSDVKEALKLIDDDIEVHLSCETKEAFNNISSLKIDKRVTTIYLGILDLLESLELPQELLNLSSPTIEYILSKFLIDTKAVGFYPVSFIYQDYKNTQEFRSWCKKVKTMGYTAKAVISPTQVDIVNEIFKPSQQQLKKAKYIQTIFEQKQKEGLSGFSDEKYGFIDEPIYKNALLILKENNENTYN